MRFNALGNRLELVHLYHLWVEVHRPLYAKYYGLVAMLLVAVMIPFDFLFFGADGAIYAAGHLAMFPCFAIALAALAILRRLRPEALRSGLAISLITAAPGVILTLGYACFLMIAKPEQRFTVLIGNIIVAFCITLFCTRFWREQYCLTIAAVVTTALIAAFFPAITREAMLVAIAYLCSFTLAFVMRREFVGSMYERYLNLSSLVPKRVAMALVMAEENLADTTLFAARERFTVCLCADWRGFQAMTRGENAAAISGWFERYYDIVFRELEDAAPGGGYYADWVADELFVVFYDDNDDQAAVLRHALAFLQAMRERVPTTTRQALGQDIRFDIGIAAGSGILGLQGPPQRKKTTITAEVAGIAKRLEQEAKAVRAVVDPLDPRPVVLMDAAVAAALAAAGLTIDIHDIQPHATTSADLRNVQVYVWLPTRPTGKTGESGHSPAATRLVAS